MQVTPGMSKNVLPVFPYAETRHTVKAQNAAKAAAAFSLLQQRPARL